ncbi:MAG: protoporphyrinogen oxidase, partial [Ignavibacteriales bacterium]|nr:protoporphyrinogen oxidase [Ignavibacteriales bacterium]
MQTLPRSLAARLGDSLKLGTTVDHIIPLRAGTYPIYTVSYRHEGVQQTVDAAAVVLAAPAYRTASIIRPIDPEMATTLESIYYPPVAEVFLGFKIDQVNQSLDGFGFLVPEIEHRKILGAIWSSTLFPKRAPEGSVALTTFVGGARQPDLVSMDNDQLTMLALEELHSLMGVQSEPVYSRIIRWERAIPQYNLGYYRVLKAMDRFEQNFRGAFLCGNFRGGIAVGDCIMNAEKVANRIVAIFTK